MERRLAIVPKTRRRPPLRPGDAQAHHHRRAEPAAGAHRRRARRCRSRSAPIRPSAAGSGSPTRSPSTDELSTDPSRLADGETVTRTRHPRAPGHAARGAAAAAGRLRALAHHLRRPGRAPADPDRRRPGLRGGLGLAVPPRDRRARRDPAGDDPLLQRHHARRWTPSRSRRCRSATRASTRARSRPATSTRPSGSSRPAALLAGLAAGAALVLRGQAPDATRAGWHAARPPLVAGAALADAPGGARRRPPRAPPARLRGSAPRPPRRPRSRQGDLPARAPPSTAPTSARRCAAPA